MYDVQETVDPDQMAQLQRLVAQLGSAEEEIERREAALSEAKQVARELAENSIPELMQSIGLTELTTTEGLRIKLREEIRASFFPKDKAKREPAYEWLRVHHHDGLIKNRVEVIFNREQSQLAKDFVDYCDKFGTPLNVSQNMDIHNQTLVAFLKERVREGEEVPLDLFGAFVQKFARIERR